MFMDIYRISFFNYQCIFPIFSSLWYISKVINCYSRVIVVIMNSWIFRVYQHLKNQFAHHVMGFLSSFIYLELDLIWATQLVFLEKQRTFTLPVHLVHAPSFCWSHFSFAFVSFCVLFWLFHVLCCVCLFPLFCCVYLIFLVLSLSLDFD